MSFLAYYKMIFSFETISIVYGIDIFYANWRIMNPYLFQITMEFRLIDVKYIDL